MSNNNIKKAAIWREGNNYTGKGGVVVIFNNEIQGWMNELRDPQHWQKGCVAVAEDGTQWTTVGGNNQDGAESWEYTLTETE